MDPLRSSICFALYGDECLLLKLLMVPIRQHLCTEH